MNKLKLPTITTATDIQQNQDQDLSRKLYWTTSEQAKQLDDARSCAKSINDLFIPSLQIKRRKFCQYCERLIFFDPLLYGKKTDELLWRKSFYDPVATSKKLKKREFTTDEIYNLQTHINSGIGYYHHLIARIQNDFNLCLKNIVDFPLFEGTDEGIEWAQNMVHQCLIYLGDLNRYKLEICQKFEPILAYRYYFQALTYKPLCGMPHNQMGTFAMSQNRFLDAVYHFMRCIACKFSFEGATNNLQQLFDKNAKYLEELPQQNGKQTPNKDDIKRFISRFLLLIDIWYFNKKISKVYNLCHQTYKDLENCLTNKTKSTSSDCNSPTIDNNDNEHNNNDYELYLTDDMLFKMVIICLLTISKLQKNQSSQLSTIVAFTLAIYSQLLQHITNHIQENILNFPLNEIDIKINTDSLIKNLLNNKKSSKLRRRKILKNDSDSDEDDENNNINNNNNNNDESEDESFENDLLANSSSSDDDDDDDDDDDNNDGKKKLKENFENDIKNDPYKKVQYMNGNDMIEIINEQTSLQSIKILNDWLIQDPEIIKSCGINTRTLLRQTTNLLNLININLNCKLNGVDFDIKNIIKNEKKIPLSEDIILKGIDILLESHKDIDWNFNKNKKCMNIKEETIVRIIKIIHFGKFLTKFDETGVSFNQQQNIFICKCNEENNKITENTQEYEQNEENDTTTIVINKFDDRDSESKGQLMKMKHMGQLWLASEVRALENRVKGKSSLSPYLVLDTDALIKYTFMVKHLVHSRKFIVLIPSAVVSALDDLKREQSEARDAIRWLESQFHRGNRFFRAQRPQEKSSIPFIKYPKKKDKEMTLYIQIIECCHYLAQQQKGASNLVTLLIGNQNVLTNGENKAFSYVGLAESVGITIELITQFYYKLKKSFKGKR